MRFLLTFATLMVGLVFVSSCTSPAGIVADLSKIYINDPNVATVTIMRKSQLTGAGGTVKFDFDGQTIAHLGTGNCVEMQVLPGEHYVAVSVLDDLEDVIRFDAKANNKYYFYISMGMSDYIMKLEQLTSQEGKHRLAQNKFKMLTANK